MYRKTNHKGGLADAEGDTGLAGRLFLCIFLPSGNKTRQFFLCTFFSPKSGLADAESDNGLVEGLGRTRVRRLRGDSVYIYIYIYMYVLLGDIVYLLSGDIV